MHQHANQRHQDRNSFLGASKTLCFITTGHVKHVATISSLLLLRGQQFFFTYYLAYHPPRSTLGAVGAGRFFLGAGLFFVFAFVVFFSDFTCSLFLVAGFAFGGSVVRRFDAVVCCSGCCMEVGVNARFFALAGIVFWCWFF